MGVGKIIVKQVNWLQLLFFFKFKQK